MAAFHFDLGSRGIVLHTVIESLAYLVGFQIYSRTRKQQGDFLTTDVRLHIIVAAIAGAAVGSKVLAWFEWPAETLQHIRDPLFLIQGKTILGALLGGTAALNGGRLDAESLSEPVTCSECPSQSASPWVASVVSAQVSMTGPMAWQQHCPGVSILVTASLAIRPRFTRLWR